MAAKKTTNETGSESTNDTGPVIATVDEDTAASSSAVAVVEQEEIVVDDATAPAEPAPPQVVYVTVPQPPRKKGNRGFGALMALVGALIFAVTLAVVLVLINFAVSGRANASFLSSPTFYIPVLFFAVGLIIVVLLVNRAGWWSYVIGSIVVALVVYFGTVGSVLLINGIVLETPTVAAQLFREALREPFTIAAALVAREVAIWTGVVISNRGRKVTTRNLTARETFAREEAERAAERAGH